MAQCLRSQPHGRTSSVPSNTWPSAHYLRSPVPGDPTSSSGWLRHCTCDTHICLEAKHTNQNKLWGTRNRIGWGGIHLSSAFGRQRQKDFSEFEANLIVTASSRTARATWWKLALVWFFLGNPLFFHFVEAILNVTKVCNLLRNHS